MAENDVTGRVLGLSLDGTGYGTDGTIWGGELLLCDASGFERLGSVQPFTQTGGDLSAKEGWRIAAARWIPAISAPPIRTNPFPSPSRWAATRPRCSLR